MTVIPGGKAPGTMAYRCEEVFSAPDRASAGICLGASAVSGVSGGFQCCLRRRWLVARHWRQLQPARACSRPVVASKRANNSVAWVARVGRAHRAAVPQVLPNSWYEMPSLEEHSRQTQIAFGATYEHVHCWLDELAGKPPHGMRHRQFRHHAAGVEEVRRRWGNTAAEAARLHIEMDLLEEGWTYGDPFPRNESHFIGLGLV